MKKWLSITGIVYCFCLAFLLFCFFSGKESHLYALMKNIKDSGSWAIILYTLFYAIGTVLLIPCSLLTVGAGLLFGFQWGFLSALTGACLGALLSFLTSRHIIQAALMKHLENNPIFVSINKAAKKNGFKLVLLLRLSPPIPFIFANYALGISTIKLRDYMLGSVGLIPSILLYAHIGTIANGLDSVQIKNILHSPHPINILVKALGSLCTLLLVLFLIRIAHKELAQQMDLEEK